MTAILKYIQIVLLCSEANSYYHSLFYYLVKNREQILSIFNIKKMISRPALIFDNAQIIYDRDK